MILLYHNIVPDIQPYRRWCIGQALPLFYLKRQITWLSKYFKILPLDEYLSRKNPNRGISRYISITFDDGLKSSFQYASSILQELCVPATFFVSTTHLENGNLLWFSYLNALCFEGVYTEIFVCNQVIKLESEEQCKQARFTLEKLAKESGDPVIFCQDLMKGYPLPSAVHDLYVGMTSAQIQSADRSGIFTIGSHTKTHPYLSQKSPEDQMKEIYESKEILTYLCHKPIDYFAYPGGDYNRTSILLVKEAKFRAAFSVVPDRLNVDPSYEIGRVGIYSPSMVKLFFKLIGVNQIRQRFYKF